MHPEEEEGAQWVGFNLAKCAWGSAGDALHSHQGVWALLCVVVCSALAPTFILSTQFCVLMPCYHGASPRGTLVLCRITSPCMLRAFLTVSQSVKVRAKLPTRKL